MKIQNFLAIANNCKEKKNQLVEMNRVKSLENKNLNCKQWLFC